MNATDRADAVVEGVAPSTLAAGPSVPRPTTPTRPSARPAMPPAYQSSLPPGAIEPEPLAPVTATAGAATPAGVPLEPSVSHHAHFDLPPGEHDERGAGKPIVDIEHVPVNDDPRDWPARKKNFVMILMTVAVLGPMISPSIYNPVIDDVQADLHATSTQLGLSISLYILFQGCVPVLWASTAEIVGRKPIYLSSFVLYIVGSAVGSRAQSMGLLIAMRCVQAMGSSAVLSVGAGSLADMYEIHERGKKLGWYYGMPMMGPALGPLIGGALGNAYGWRSTMYFLACFAALCFVFFLFFPDTYRRERSRVYQKAMADAIKRALKHDEAKERKRQRKLERGLSSNAATPPTTTPGTPWGTHTPARVSGAQTPSGAVVAERATLPPAALSGEVDTERNEVVVKRRWWQRGRRREAHEHEPIRLSIRDVNPLPTMISIFHSPTNAVILISSGLLFAAQYTTTYTASITFSNAPYNYTPLQNGLVLLSFGLGNIFGSVFGGRYSDYMLRRLKRANGGVSVPESTMIGMPFMLAAYLVYAWTCDFKTSVAGPVVGLFVAGLALMVVYSSQLAYLVDANPGRSASAVSCNSFCRGASACVMSQVAEPIRNAIGDGGLYTLFTGILALACAGIITIAYKGESWRAHGLRGKKDKRTAMDKDVASTSEPATAAGSSVSERASDEKSSQAV